MTAVDDPCFPTRRALLGRAAALLSAGRAIAAPGDRSEYAALLKGRIDDQKKGTGAALGVLRAGKRSVIGHGRLRKEPSPTPDGRTVFQIASLTKVFTALLLADSVRRGEVGLADPIDRFMDTAGPAFDGRSITLVDLATHSSGLPLRPASRLDRGQDNPYAGYSEADLQADFAAASIDRRPGARFEYSNFGYALLGRALARAAGTTYPALLTSRILAPLGLADTTLEPGARLLARRIAGYDGEFKAAAPWDFGALAPAGGLYSTIDDLLRFLALFTARQRSGLAEAAASMRGLARPGDDPQTRMALGWRVTRADGGPTVLWTNGSGGGVRAFMGFNPADGVGVVGFANMATNVGVDDIGMHVLDPSRPADVSVAPVRQAIAVPTAVLDRYVGTYTYAPGDSMIIERNGDGLTFRQGPSPTPLLAESQTLFFIRDANITFEFEPRSEGPSNVLIFTERGVPYRYLRDGGGR